jgi:hypothetical protein
VCENDLLEINVCSNGLLLIIPFHMGAVSYNISLAVIKEKNCVAAQ